MLQHYVVLTKLYNRHAHFLKQDFKAFDAPFFSVTPKEAKAMDPTHRMLLEATYEGFENGNFLGRPGVEKPS